VSRRVLHLRGTKRVLRRADVRTLRGARGVTKSLGLADSRIRTRGLGGPIDVVANYCEGMVQLHYCTSRAQRFAAVYGWPDVCPAVLFGIPLGSMRYGASLRVECIGSDMEVGR
jgi:hypothetical protein